MIELSIILGLFAAMLFGIRFLPVRTKVRDQLDRNANASNNLFRILMKRGLGKYASAIWAQEYFEVLLKRINILKHKKLEFRNEMELMSHEVEVQIAVTRGADEVQYRNLEALALHRGYQGRFAHMSPEEIYGILESNKGEALKFIDKHRDKIVEARKYE